MRFVHTADWQIGMKAVHAGAAAEKVRRIRLESAWRVVGAAGAYGAEFILLAGDTFEDNGVERVLVQRVADILARSAVPVYVIPGNHDPLAPGSVWDHPVWRELANVRVLREPEAVEVPGGVLYPCPVLEKHSRKDPTAWIPARQGEGIRIGMAHGTVEGMPRADPDHPVPRDASSRAGLDYLALGHWHSTALYHDSRDGSPRTAYAGTHETTRFGERDSGNVLHVEIAAPSAPPKVTPVRTGSLEWLLLEETVTREGDLGRVRAHLERVGSPDRTLVEVRLTGFLEGSAHTEWARFTEVLASRFLHHKLDVRGLRPAPEDDGWLEVLPQGVLREAALQLREQANAQTAGSGDTGFSPRVAAQALMELYTMAEGIRS